MPARISEASVKALFFVFISFYFASIPEPFFAKGLTVIIAVMGYCFLTFKLGRTLSLITPGEFVIIAILMLLYLLLQIKGIIWGVGFFGKEELGILSAAARPITPVIVYLIFRGFAGESRERALFLTRLLGLFLCFSTAVFILSYVFPSEAIALRERLYWSSIEAHVDEGYGYVVVNILFTGIAPIHYLYVYQISGLMLVVALAMVDRGWWKGLWAMGVALTILAVVLGRERAPVMALSAGLVAYAALSFRRLDSTHLRLLGAASAVLLVAAGVMTIKGDDIFRLYEDLKDERLTVFGRHFQDLETRLLMQVAAVEISLENPLGLFFSGLREEDWADLAMEKGYEVVPEGDNKTPALVHNGYLRVLMYFGWIAGAGMLYVLLKTFRVIMAFRGSLSGEEVPGVGYGRAVAAALVALFVQAMFQNDSLFTFEKTTWLSFCLLMIWARSLGPADGPGKVLTS